MVRGKGGGGGGGCLCPRIGIRSRVRQRSPTRPISRRSDDDFPMGFDPLPPATRERERESKVLDLDPEVTRGIHNNTAPW